MPAPIVLLWAKHFPVSYSGNNVQLEKAPCHKSSVIFKSKLCGENWHALDSNFLSLSCLTLGDLKFCFPQSANITKICPAPIQLTVKTERQLNKTWSEGGGLLAMYLFENSYSGQKPCNTNYLLQVKEKENFQYMLDLLLQDVRILKPHLRFSSTKSYDPKFKFCQLKRSCQFERELGHEWELALSGPS